MTITLDTILNSVRQTVNENIIELVENAGMDRDEAIKIVNEIDPADVMNVHVELAQF